MSILVIEKRYEVRQTLRGYRYIVRHTSQLFSRADIGNDFRAYTEMMYLGKCPHDRDGSGTSATVPLNALFDVFLRDAY